MKVYLIAHALKDGIKLLDVNYENSVYVWRTPSGYTVWMRLGRDIALTESEAIQAVELQRQKRMASLKKELAKLEALKIEIATERTVRSEG